MNRLIAASLTLSLAACGFGQGAADFKNGVPAAKDVELTVPAKSGQPLSGDSTRKDGLEGDTAAFYQVTRAVTVTVNSGTVAVLGLVALITNEQPTTSSATEATWGPYTDSLSPNTWRLVVQKVSTDNYTYSLEGRGKNEADTAFRAVLTGAHNHLGKNLGKGTFMIDWDVAKTLPEHDLNVGQATFTYSRETTTTEASIEVVFHQVKDTSSGQLVDANYLYKSKPGNGGNFEFTMKKDLVAGAAIESITINSRWQETGAGRSDVRAKGGDLTSDATASECWDSNFASRYLETSYAPSSNYGAASVCAFQSAAFSTLAL